MAFGFQCGSVGLTDASSVPASAVVSPNQRVRTASGLLATVADVVQFPGPSVIGQWLVPAQRCRASQLPLIHQGCTGLAYTLVAGVPTPAGPLRINLPDARAQGR